MRHRGGSQVAKEKKKKSKGKYQGFSGITGKQVRGTSKAGAKAVKTKPKPQRLEDSPKGPISKFIDKHGGTMAKLGKA